MREVISFEVNGSPVVIGYSCMMAPTAFRETNRVFRMLRLNADLGEEGSIFFFEFRCSKNGKEEWVLLPEFCFINHDGPTELIEVYEKIPHMGQTTWDEFIELVFRAYYWEG